jgi:hypothetical protein
MQGTPNQLSGRRANRRTKAHAGNPERIIVTTESQYSVASTDAYNKSSLCENDANRTDLRLRWCRKAHQRQAQDCSVNGRSNDIGSIPLHLDLL